MYLFIDKEKIDIPITCKLCLTEIGFSISMEEYKKINVFPFKKEFIHGDPSHKLIVFINKNLEIERFKIEEVIDKEHISYSEELTLQVLSEIGLTDEEIELYFLTSGRDIVSLGEMTLLINKSKEECQKMAEKFVQKGLFKEIIGATPHYTALPPYAALISQLQKFNNYISEIKTYAPAQLNQSFSELESKTEAIKDLQEFTEYMRVLKDDFLEKMAFQKKIFNTTISEIEKINSINEIISNFENDTKSIISGQIEELSKQFNDIKVVISKNLQKLQLGIIRQTVDRIIDNILTTRIKEITKEFNNQFVLKIQKLIKNIMKKVEEITFTTTEQGENIKYIFESLSKDFSKAVVTSEEKLRIISENIFQSIDELKTIFSTKVIDALNEQLANILNRLEISQTITNEFWNQAKKVSLFTMKDIWFIRSIESVKAHINEEILKAKMRILIVAPQITDIDIHSLLALPQHVNIRIATYIDGNFPNHLAILEELDKMQNVSYRNRYLRNLWGINRDYEEVILCIVSNVEIGGAVSMEIGGVGSILQEHIKIFVPVLEEAWIGAQKEKIFKKTSFITESIAKPLKTQIFQDLPSSPSELQQKSLIPDNTIKMDITLPKRIQPSKNSSLSDQFDNILKNLDKITGHEISLSLELFHNDYIENKGYNSVLLQIRHNIKDLQNNIQLLNKLEMDQLVNVMNFWRKKLEI